MESNHFIVVHPQETSEEEKVALTDEESEAAKDVVNVYDSPCHAKYLQNLPSTSSQTTYDKVTFKDVNSNAIEKLFGATSNHNDVELNSDNSLDDIPQTTSQVTAHPEVHGLDEFDSLDTWNSEKSFNYNHGSNDYSLMSSENFDDTCDGTTSLEDEFHIDSEKIHEKQNVTLKGEKRKSFEDIIDLTSDYEDEIQDDVYLDKFGPDFLANKQFHLKIEKQKLNIKEMDFSFQLKNPQSDSTNIEKGLFPSLKRKRINNNIESEKKKLKSIFDSETLMDKQMLCMTGDQYNVPCVNKFRTDPIDLDWSDFDEKELVNIDRNVTEDTIEKLHESINNQPERFSAEPKFGLKVSLLPHQKYGLGWALWRESQEPSGGILADDMGLGKTLTMISLILYTLKDEKNKDNDRCINPARQKIPDGGTLVIVPASLLSQWLNEINSKVFTGQMSYYLYHGPSRKKEKRLPNFHIVLSTYGTVQKESFNDPLMKINWKRVILDEAHIIRNRKSKQASSIFDLECDKRWALTGTPVQNQETDLYNILKFLRCKPFDDYKIWKKLINKKDVAGIMRLNCILKSILLRRTKEELKHEGHLASLKSKTYHDIPVLLNEEEYEVYKSVAYFSKTLFLQLIKQKAEKESLFSTGICSVRPSFKVLFEENPFPDHPELRELYSDMMSLTEVEAHHILVLMLRLRQICVHPALARSVLDKNELENDGIDSDEHVEIPIVDRLYGMSLSATPEISNNIFYRARWSSKLRAVVECVMDIFGKTRDKIIIVSQWVKALDIIKEYLMEKDIDFVEFNGNILMKKRPEIIAEFNEHVFGPRVMLLSLMAGGTGLNLMGANHLILVDCHWNPQVEAQAFDRIYRVGQLKEVHIYKFICTNTIEERIVELQKRKLALSHNVLNGSIITSGSKLTLNDLKMLFNVN
ncbi:hypothetical protein O3M35_011247 [Rhynocoris fuscipes]|uniref:Transcription termination factor 2 n=1 Tax=Rhynocoris fuscipes TaxID=488301 RepID=A0AAW1D014_9HEMI